MSTQDQTHEEWRVVPDFPNYMVSNFGGVKSLRGKEERLLSGTMTTSGLRVELISATGRVRSFAVARLVLTTFKPLVAAVSHRAAFKDGDTCHVHLDNLEWRLRPKGKLTATQVIEIRRLYKEDLSLSYAKLAKRYGVTASTIKAAIAKTSWTHVGLIAEGVK